VSDRGLLFVSEKGGASLRRVFRRKKEGEEKVTLTAAILSKLPAELGIPVVSMFHDGHGNQNQRLEVFLNNAVKRAPQPPRRPTRPRAAVQPGRRIAGG
jgi:hypothetical protein